MFKKRLKRLILAGFLALALTGVSGVVADTLDLPGVDTAYACEPQSGTGGC